MKSLYTSYMWLMPFCFFAIGYIGARYYTAPHIILMPSLIGMHATEALITISTYNLTPHIIAQKEDNDLPHGTILQQNPAPGQKIKKRQSIFLVISTISKPVSMPHYIHMSLHDIQQQSKKENMNVITHQISHSWPQLTCFAQWPSAGETLTNQTPIVYISAPSLQTIIWPNMIGQEAQTVISFLQSYGINPDIICQYAHADEHSYTGKRIIDQRPLAGSCVSIDKPNQLMVQLRVE